MKEDLINGIYKISDLTFKEVGSSEENVKQKIIVPLLECLGHNRNNLDFEYRSESKLIDIFIKGLPRDCKVIKDTKKYNENLDKHLDQIGFYSYKIGALLAIIANGEEIRIYSPSFKGYSFEDSLLYSIKRKKLKSDIGILQNFLSRENLISKKTKEYIAKREEEISTAFSAIDRIENGYNCHIKALEEEIKELKNKIEISEQKIAEWENKRDDNIRSILQSYRIILTKTKPIKAHKTKNEVIASIKGKKVKITKEDIIAASKNPEIENFPYRTKYALIGSKKIAVKGLISLATGISKSEFNSIQAKNILHKLGFTVS